MQSALKKYFVNEGTFGKVYKFSYQDKTYAVKKVKGNCPSFSYEVECLKHLPKHRNIVKYYGYTYDYNNHLGYLIYEFLEGFTLKEINKQLAHNDIPQKVVFNWMMQSLLALDHLKKHGIIHRDIKPENIIITK